MEGKITLSVCSRTHVFMKGLRSSPWISAGARAACAITNNVHVGGCLKLRCGCNLGPDGAQIRCCFTNPWYYSFGPGWGPNGLELGWFGGTSELNERTRWSSNLGPKWARLDLFLPQLNLSCFARVVVHLWPNLGWGVAQISTVLRPYWAHFGHQDLSKKVVMKSW